VHRPPWPGGAVKGEVGEWGACSRRGEGLMGRTRPPGAAEGHLAGLPEAPEGTPSCRPLGSPGGPCAYGGKPLSDTGSGSVAIETYEAFERYSSTASIGT